MKKVLFGLTLLITSSAFAATTTDMQSKWRCTTNASSSSVETEKSADDQMAKHQGTAKGSFEFAAKNCRDCTKITCDVE